MFLVIFYLYLFCIACEEVFPNAFFCGGSFDSVTLTECRNDFVKSSTANACLGMNKTNE